MSTYIGENIYAFRADRGLSQEQLAKRSQISQSTISAWEVGKTIPRARNLQKLVDAFDGLTLDDFMSEDVGYAKKSLRTGRDIATEIPLYGSIAAGQPIEMTTCDETYFVPAAVRKRYPEGFLLKVTGESMNRRIPNGAYALIDPTDTLLDGKIFAVAVGDCEATIKRVRVLPTGVELVPDSMDPSFLPSTFDCRSGSAERLTIIGRVVWYTLPPDFEL